MKSNVKHVSLRPASLALDKDPWFANASIHFQSAIYQALESHRDMFANRFPHRPFLPFAMIVFSPGPLPHPNTD